MLFINVSCSEEKNNIGEDKFTINLKDVLDKKSTKGYLSFGTKTIVVNDDNTYLKFNNNNFLYGFEYEKDIKKRIKLEENLKSKTENNFEEFGISEVILTDSTDEHMIFNVKTIDGLVVEGIKFTNLNVEGFASRELCPLCWVAAIVVEVIIELNADDYNSNCAAAIEAARDVCENGIKVKLSEGGLLGGGSCEVECL